LQARLAAAATMAKVGHRFAQELSLCVTDKPRLLQLLSRRWKMS